MRELAGKHSRTLVKLPNFEEKALTVKDLSAVVEWKFKDEPEKLQRVQELVNRNDEQKYSG